MLLLLLQAVILVDGPRDVLRVEPPALEEDRAVRRDHSHRPRPHRVGAPHRLDELAVRVSRQVVNQEFLGQAGGGKGGDESIDS